MSKVYIILENGKSFGGESFGAEGSVIGELVFTTGVVGYVETLSDPANASQIILHTFPQIGNYGVMPEDFESGNCHAQAIIVRDFCETPSNFRSNGNIASLLKERGVVGVCGVDTRELTRIIRDEGSMRAAIVSEFPADTSVLFNTPANTGLVSQVSTKETYICAPEGGDAKYKVALIDYGVRRSIITKLLDCKCSVTVYPHDTAAETILTDKPDGILLSGGPGDPAENAACIEIVKKLMGELPIFGIALGHQILALAAGAKTEKLLCGHHGSNAPVRELSSSKVYITNQNHCYTVNTESFAQGKATQTYVNLNDASNEGLEYPNEHAFSIQFYPDTSVGTGENGLFFDKFLKLMDGGAM